MNWIKHYLKFNCFIFFIALIGAVALSPTIGVCLLMGFISPWLGFLLILTVPLSVYSIVMVCQSDMIGRIFDWAFEK